MKLLDELIAINSQSRDQLKTAMLHVSQHLNFLLKNAEWTYSFGIDVKRQYSEKAQKLLITTIEQEYETLVSAEMRLNLNNLREISDYYYFTSIKLFEENGIRIPIDHFQLTKKLEPISVQIERTDSETEEKNSHQVKNELIEIQQERCVFL